MSLASVLQLINTEIVPNGNNEIDAITLQDVLVKMLLQPNELIGLLSNLQTVDKTDLVSAINELVNDISNINVINVTQGIPNPNNNPGLTPQTADFYRQLTGGGALVGMWIYNSEKWILLSDEYISFAVNQGLNAGQQQIGRDNLDVYSKSETNSAISSAFLGLGNIVNSVNGVNVDNSDPKNPIIATFRPLADYQNDMLLKADIDGGLTIGGIWWQDQVLSDRFSNYKQVWTALSNNTIEWGNIELDKHIFLVDDIDGIKIKVGGVDGTVWNTLNLTDVSQLNNDAGYLQSNDLDGFIYDVTYNSTTHTITFYQQNEPNIVIDLPIESLIKGVQLVGDDLVFTFEDGSTVTVPLNTLLVGVVKSVNGKTPNSQGEIILNVTDIPNLSSELANKLDIRMAGLVSNLTPTEQSDIRTKLGIINNVVQTLGLSGNTLTLSGGGGSVNLGIANIGGLQTALNAKVDLDGSNSTGALLDSINKRHDAVSLGANSVGLNLVGQVLQFSAGYQLPTSNEITNWNNLVGNIGNYALNNGSNLTTPATWRTNLGVYSTTQVDGFLAGKANTNHTHYYLTDWADTRNIATIPNDYNGRFEAKGIKDGSLYGAGALGAYASVFGYRGWLDSSGGNAIEFAIPYSSNDLWFRTGTTTSWNSLVRIWHSENFDPNTKANTSGYYLGLSVGNADNATLWNGNSLEWVSPVATSNYMIWDGSVSRWRVTDTLGMQNALGINTSWNLQQVTNNGASTTNTVYLSGGANITDLFFKDNSQNLGVYLASLSNGDLFIGSHSNYGWTADLGSINYNGTFQWNGTIATASHGTSADWNAKVSQSQLADYVSRLNVNQNIGGTKTFTGSYTGWTLNGDANNARGFAQSTVNDFLIGTLNNKNFALYRNSVEKVLIGNSSVSFVDNVIIPNATAPNHAVAFGQLANYVPTSRTLTINGTTFDLSQNRTWTIPVNTYTGSNGIDVSGTVISPTYGTTANTIAQGNDARFHNAVTLGTANGLSLSGQVLSLGLASASTNGALSSTDWNNFNNKVSANNGNITYVGTGNITGGGTSSANQSGNTNYSFDLTAQTKTDIGLGVAAYNSLGNYQLLLANGLHTILNGNKIDVAFDVNTYVKDKLNNDRLLFGNTASTDVVIKGAVANGDFKVKDSTDTDLFRINGSNKVAYFPQLPAPQTGDAYLAMFDAGNGLWKHSTRISDLVTISILNAGLATKANVNGNNLTNINDWRTNLGVYSTTQVDGFLSDKVTAEGAPYSIAFDGFENYLRLNGNLIGYLWHSENFDPNTKANTSGYYLGLSVGNADNATLWNGNSLEWVSPVATSNYMIWDGSVSRWRVTDTLGMQNALGINTSWNLQQVVQNGNTSTLPLIVGNTSYGSSAIFNDVPFAFATNTGNAQTIYTGGLLASNSYTDASLIPTNGIYSKGTIATASSLLLSPQQGGGASIAYNSNGNLDITPRTGYHTLITSGAFGVGLIDPNYRFSVAGDINATGMIYTGYHGTSADWNAAFLRGDFRDYGLGINNPPQANIDTNFGSGFYNIFPGTVGTLPFPYASLINIGFANTEFAQIAIQAGAEQIKYRIKDGNGNVRNWVTLWDSLNLSDPATQTWVINNFASNTALGNYALANGTNITNIAGWKTTLNTAEWGEYDGNTLAVQGLYGMIYDNSVNKWRPADNTLYKQWLDLSAYALNSSLANYALLSQIPTNNNQLANGANYTTLPIVQSWIGTQGFFQFPSGGNSGQYLNGIGQLVNFPTIPPQLVYTGSNGINVIGTVISPTYGTTAGTIAQGNDIRIINGQTAFDWGNHAGLYPLLSGSYANPTWITSLDYSKITNAPTIPTVGNGQLSFSAPTGLVITGTFNANQSGNTNIPIAYAAGYQGYTTSESVKLGNLQNITINGATYSLQNNPNITVTATPTPRTTENVTVSGGGNVPLSVRKTRVTIMDSGAYDIPNGTEDGDSLFIVFCEANGDFGGQIRIKHMDKCLNIVDDMLFVSNRGYYFWWSEVDGCWLGLLI